MFNLIPSRFLKHTEVVSLHICNFLYEFPHERPVLIPRHAIDSLLSSPPIDSGSIHKIYWNRLNDKLIIIQTNIQISMKLVYTRDIYYFWLCWLTSKFTVQCYFSYVSASSFAQLHSTLVCIILWEAGLGSLGF